MVSSYEAQGKSFQLSAEAVGVNEIWRRSPQNLAPAEIADSLAGAEHLEILTSPRRRRRGGQVKTVFRLAEEKTEEIKGNQNLENQNGTLPRNPLQQRRRSRTEHCMWQQLDQQEQGGEKGKTNTRTLQKIRQNLLWIRRIKKGRKEELI